MIEIPVNGRFIKVTPQQIAQHLRENGTTTPLLKLYASELRLWQMQNPGE